MAIHLSSSRTLQTAFPIRFRGGEHEHVHGPDCNHDHDHFEPAKPAPKPHVHGPDCDHDHDDHEHHHEEALPPKWGTRYQNPIMRHLMNFAGWFYELFASLFKDLKGKPEPHDPHAHGHDPKHVH